MNKGHYKDVFVIKLYKSLHRLLFLLQSAVLVCFAALMLLVAPPAFPKPVFPGKLVDVDGRRMHIYCEGQGLPSIIFDSGTGGFSLEWTEVQKALSQRTRVCSYDRAGYGWSELGPLPRTSDRITRELHTLLDKAGVVGPYILAGHSFGGYTAQLFAKSYPEETAGLVLIDSSHPEQVGRLPPRKKSRPRPRMPGGHSYTVTKLIPHPNYPDEIMVVANRIMSSWSHTMTWREEMTGFSLSAKQVLVSKPMPAVPVVVLTRGMRVWPNNDYGNELERVWMELQEELSRLSGNSVHLIAERSGHMIHLDQPEIVINAINTMLDSNFPDK